MALFPDGPLSSIEDLQNYESSLPEIAQTEKIDLDVKLQVSKVETGHRILQFLIHQSANGHLQFSRDLAHVVISDPLREWYTLHTLQLILRDCYHNQLNDRYRAKWIEYQKESAQAEIRYFDHGAGLVLHPIKKAAEPSLERSDGELEAGVYELAITWSADGRVEGAPSDPLIFETGDGSIPLLHPQSVQTPVHFWNVYLGLSGTPLMKQNVEPIGIHESWSPTSNTVLSGAVMGEGQSPDLLIRPVNRIRRG